MERDLVFMWPSERNFKTILILHPYHQAHLSCGLCFIFNRFAYNEHAFQMQNLRLFE